MIHYGDDGLAYCGREVVALTMLPWRVKCGNCLANPQVRAEIQRWAALAEGSL